MINPVLTPGVRTLTAKKKSAKKPAAQKAKKQAVKKPVAKKVPAKKEAAKAAPAKKKPVVPVKAKAKAKAKAPASRKAAPKAVKPKVASRPKPVKPQAKAAVQSDLIKRIVASLDDDKAENIVTIDLEGRSALCDAAVIASGRSSRHVAAIADHLARKLKDAGYGSRPISGAGAGDWVLVDAGDVIVHIFRPEVREYYDLEGMWNVGTPAKAF